LIIDILARNLLLMGTKRNKLLEEYRNTLIVKLRGEGKDQRAVGEMVGLKQSQVSVILKRYDEEGTTGLHLKKVGGSKARLSGEQKATLFSKLIQPATAYGFQGDYWTRKRVGAMIKEWFWVSYSERHVGDILKLINFTRQKPLLKDYRQSEVKQQQWRNETLPAIKKSAGG
jgi:transposase